MRLLPIEVHPLTPILFAEAGAMPNHQGGMKECWIVVTFGALFLIRPAVFPAIKYKVSVLLATWLLESITYQGAHTRLVATRMRRSFFVCAHAQEATACLLTAFRLLHEGAPRRAVLAMHDFPDPVAPIYVADLVNAGNIAQIRCICVAQRYGQAPAPGLIRVLGTLEPGRSRTLVLDEGCVPEENLRAISLPVSQMGGLAVVLFRSIPAYAACHLTTDFLRNSRTIRTFIFETYSKFVARMFAFGSCVLCGREPVSFIFRNFSFSETEFCELLHQLGELRGDLQRLTFSVGYLSSRVWRELALVARTCKCFRCLEVFEVDQVRCWMPPPPIFLRRSPQFCTGRADCVG
jgi:hypothetical protein